MAGTPAAAPVAAQQQGGLGTFQSQMRDMYAPLFARADELGAMKQEEADATQRADEAQVAAAEARAKAAETADADTRARLQKRAEDLEGKRDNALVFALVRGLAHAVAGGGRDTLANLGRGLVAGVEGYAADTAKIDQLQEGLRAEYAKLDEMRAKMADASGKELEQMRRNVAVQAAKTKNVGRQFTMALGLDVDKAVIDKSIDLLVKGEEIGMQGEQRLREIAATGAEARKTQASKPPAATAASTRGQITEKDLASERSKAASEWDKSLRLRKQYPSKDAYVQDRLRVFTGQTDNAGASTGTRMKFDAQGNPIN